MVRFCSILSDMVCNVLCLCLQAICDWMESVKADGCAGVVVTGDLNAPPQEDVHAIFQKHGYYSANKVRAGDVLTVYLL